MTRISIKKLELNAHVHTSIVTNFSKVKQIPVKLFCLLICHYLNIQSPRGLIHTIKKTIHVYMYTYYM